MLSATGLLASFFPPSTQSTELLIFERIFPLSFWFRRAARNQNRIFENDFDYCNWKNKSILKQ